MADIVYTGGAARQGSSGSGFGEILKDLLPVAVLAGAAYLAYVLLTGSGSSNTAANNPQGSGGQGYNQNQQSQANTPTQASQNNNSNGSAGNQTGGPVQFGGGVTVTDVQLKANAQLQAIIGAIPRTVAQGGYVINQVPNFVTAGPTTPASFYPGTVATISSSQNLTGAEQAEVYQNLLNSGISNAWWSPYTTVTQTTQPGGVNSGASFQSNIPVGKKHCKCPYPGCGPNDDWTYC